MNQKDKELLLKDLCARLPYNVICFKNVTNCHPGDSVLLEEDIYSFRTGKPTEPDYGQHDYYRTIILELKPYLRPMSSMTEEETKEYRKTQITKWVKSVDCTGGGYYEHRDTLKTFDWLLAHHFDYRGLIEKGLAIPITEENNPYKE